MTPRLPVVGLFDLVKKLDHESPSSNEYVVYGFMPHPHPRFELMHVTGAWSTGAFMDKVVLIRPLSHEELKSHPNLRIRELYTGLQAQFDPFNL